MSLRKLTWAANGEEYSFTCRILDTSQPERLRAINTQGEVLIFYKNCSHIDISRLETETRDEKNISNILSDGDNDIFN